MLMKLKCISYTIFFVVYVFVTIPLFAQDKRNNSFSENEMATIKKLALEALLENPDWEGVTSQVRLIGWEREGMDRYISWQK